MKTGPDTLFLAFVLRFSAALSSWSWPAISSHLFSLGNYFGCALDPASGKKNEDDAQLCGVCIPYWNDRVVKFSVPCIIDDSSRARHFDLEMANKNLEYCGSVCFLLGVHFICCSRVIVACGKIESY
jgi:hypothetical protein